MIVAIVVEEVAEGPVGPDTDDKARRKFIVEAALHDADGVAIGRFGEVAMEVEVLIAEPIVVEQAAPAIDVEIGSTDATTGAEIEACPGGDWRRRHHIRRECRRADRPRASAASSD